MKLQECLKKNIKYIFLFVLFFLCLQFFYARFAGDQIYNYGFSYALSRGEVPYNDFNMIIPPLGAFVYMIPFLIFGPSLIVFNLFQALLLTLMFYLLFKMYDKKAWLMLVVLLLPLPIPFVPSIFQGYNFLLILEFILLLYLIKNKKSDILIGILFGLMVFTKQTTGVLMFIPSILYLFKYRKVFSKRCLGFLIPCFVALIYLLVTGSLVNFFDMCLFGMLDFTSKNGGLLKIFGDFYFYLFILEIIVLVYLIIKNRKDINYTKYLIYTLIFASVAVPLFDYNHVSYFSFVVVLILLEKINKLPKRLGVSACLFTSSISIIWFLFINNFNIPNMVQFNNYKLGLLSKKNENEIKEISKYMRKNKNTIILSEYSYLVKIVLDYDIDHYDLLNYGNHGYNGTDKLIKKLDSEKDKYILVNREAYLRVSKRQQFNKEVVKYVMDNYEKVDTLGVFDIYYKE